MSESIRCTGGMPDGAARRSARVQSAIRTLLVFVFVGPGPFLVLIPFLLTGFELRDPFFGIAAMPWLGAGLLLAGAIPLLHCTLRFVTEGLGTPAPFLPPTRFVRSGLYRYVRNPMYIAIVSILLGEALLFSSTALLLYGLGFARGFDVWVRWVEEPNLRKRFGESYERYTLEVPRWIPRLRPTDAPSTTAT